MPIPEVHGNQGLLAIATALANRGWGCPLIHDITDCLRVGDLTFINPGEDIRTVELKTSLVAEKKSKKGSTSTYQAKVLFHSKGSPFPAGSADADEFAADLASQQEPARLKHSGRVERQLKRMREALDRQEAMPGQIVDLVSRERGSFTWSALAE